MNRFYLFYVSTLIGGAALGIPALISVITGEQSIPLVLQAVGGCGMAVGALYEVFSKDPAEFAVGRYTVWTLVFATLLIVLGRAIWLVS